MGASDSDLVCSQLKSSHCHAYCATVCFFVSHLSKGKINQLSSPKTVQEADVLSECLRYTCKQRMMASCGRVLEDRQPGGEGTKQRGAGEEHRDRSFTAHSNEGEFI